MIFFSFGTGLIPEIPSPPEAPEIADVATEEAAIQAPKGQALRVTALVQDGEVVARGAPVACLRDAPDVCLAAPIGGRVAHVSLLPGRTLSEIVLFREPGSDAQSHDRGAAESPAGLRRLMQRAGLWPWIRRRPFGGMPTHDERPAAILVMAADTRPYAPDPHRALTGREAELDRGLAALETLTEGPVLVCQQHGKGRIAHGTGTGRIRAVTCGARHPQGAPGIRIHQTCPAGVDAPVWDIHAEDVAALGGLLETGELPMTRLVRISGAALREARMVRTHPGADLRELTQRIVAPGLHHLISGSGLDGHAARWLDQRHRQVTVLPREAMQPRPHWLVAALTRSAGARPAIPTAALAQAFGGTVPALPFLRALGAGDDQGAMRLGILSLLEEDVALADYALGETGLIAGQLRGMLDRLESELAA